MSQPDDHGFTELPRRDRDLLLFWIGLAIALGAAVNFLAIASAAM